MKFAPLVAAVIGVLVATSAVAERKKLTPASPQPASVKSGLNVQYAYPPDVKNLADAQAALSAGAERGKPLKGLDYRDTKEGQHALTSKQEHYVAARITGYVKFDAPGNYEIEFMTNDGLDAKIGGVRVGYTDERTPCDTTRIVDVAVPEAGWYPVDILWFQRWKSSCLHMRWGKEGQKRTWTPNSAFGR
ncbi:MAG: PA14 domain-containing protein [Arenibacterium sp.]